MGQEEVGQNFFRRNNVNFFKRQITIMCYCMKSVLYQELIKYITTIHATMFNLLNINKHGKNEAVMKI